MHASWLRTRTGYAHAPSTNGRGVCDECVRFVQTAARDTFHAAIRKRRQREKKILHASACASASDLGEVCDGTWAAPHTTISTSSPRQRNHSNSTRGDSVANGLIPPILRRLPPARYNPCTSAFSLFRKGGAVDDCRERKKREVPLSAAYPQTSNDCQD